MANVQLRLEPGYYEADQQMLRSAFRMPPGPSDRSGLPYNLQPPHADALRRLVPGSTVLELGCGGGQNRRFIQGLGMRYIGSDISTTRTFAWLQEFGGPDVLFDAHFLPLPDASVDAVYCSAMTQLVASPHIMASEVARVLKPDGWFLGNVAFIEPWHDNGYFHMTPLGVVQLLRQGGFTPDYIWPEHGYSGYFSMLEMGGRVLRKLRYLGWVTHRVFRAEHCIKRLVRRQRRGDFADLSHQAMVSGAIGWIAHRSGAAEATQAMTDSTQLSVPG